MTASPYYSYKFISPDPLYAKIREELNSYFASGAIDDTMFPLWTERTLKKLGRGSYKITPSLLQVEDYSARVPDGFVAEREVWTCLSSGEVINSPAAKYSYVLETSTRLDDPDVKCNPCDLCENPGTIQAIYKTTNQVFATFSMQHLLKPGNIHHFSGDCELPCINSTSESLDTYDIHDGKIFTNFESGTIYLVYYSEERDGSGFQLIPDEIHIIEAIEAYIKYKLFEMLFNTASTETFNQMKYKMELAQQDYSEKYIAAENHMKKRTMYQTINKLKRDYTRNRRFNIR